MLPLCSAARIDCTSLRNKLDARLKRISFSVNSRASRSRLTLLPSFFTDSPATSKDAGLPLDVAKLQLSRCNFHGEAITPAQEAGIRAVGPVLLTSGKLTAGANLPQAEATLVNTSFTTELGLQ